MTLWERLRGRTEGLSGQSRRRLVLGVLFLIALALLALVGPWAIWPLATAAIWLIAIGAAVFVGIRPGRRGR